MNLSDIIVQRIKADGPISFQEYMEMCLYYPDHGYYSSKSNKIGANGDFYTSSSLTPVFGILIGKQLEEMWEILGKQPFTIVEYGAGTGMLCHDILSYLESNKQMYEQLKYCIIEKSHVMREIEMSHLSGKVSWHNSINEIPEINGCILSNELLDNFAVHQVVMCDKLMEVFIDHDQNFKEVLLPASGELIDYLNELEVTLQPGFRTEINLQAIKWIKEISSSLKSGYVMTIDYGFLSAELYKTCRSEGTLMCYKNHQINQCIYENIGGQDITSHVNFSALVHWGKKFGLEECGLIDQCHFLLAMGFKEFIQQAFFHENNLMQAARKIAVLSHTLLIDMGSKYKFLIQQKGVNGKRLSGLNHLV